MAHLEIHQPGGARRFPLGQDKVTIGRHSQNALCLDDPQVSRVHCQIEPTPEGYVLRDLNSRNGTSVNQQRVSEVVTLRPGDVITVGSTRIQFVDGPPAIAQAIPVQAKADPAPAPIARAIPVTTPVQEEEPASIDVSLGDPFDLHREEDQPPLMTTRSDFASGELASLAKVGRDVPYDDSRVALINGRGNVVHAANRGDEATAQTIRVLRLLILACIRTGASDLHLEPKQDRGTVRMRVDGTMVEAAQLPAELSKRLQSLVKVLGDIDIAKKSMVQEGHFSAQTPDRRIDYRVSFTPAMFGQKLVIRVLDPRNSPQNLRDLGLPPWMHNQIRSISRQDAGMLLVCGPTGSGKTTTLYAVLRQIDAKQRNVITIEDPVEYELPGATQIPVDEQQGNTFHSLLRSCLRQDPDVIVVGEIRDKETATTAMQAATTGHLVMSTVHAKDTLGTIFRLLDLGVEPYLVASTLNLVLAQRLARQLCPHCKVGKKPTPSQTLRLGRSVTGVSEIYFPAGCPRCFGTGYSGRQAVFELLSATDELRDVIIKSPNIGAMKKAIEMTMFTSLRDNGMDLVLKGLTSIDEIDRVIGME
ncbi:MAG TPA: ATPase, T2SS/T4P/T4SS family [Phycisphaeraceae bacterium]